MALQSDGKLLAAAGVDAFSYAFRRLNDDGSLDESFQTSDIQCCVGAIALQSDEKVLFGGLFCTGGLCTIGRLNPDGSFDPTFNPGTGADDYVWAITVQPDGKILIGGEFTTYNGIARDGIARLNSDGSLDTSFDPGTGVTGQGFGSISDIAVQPDGKILIAGYFTYYNEVAMNSFARLNSDGTLDQSFDPGSGVGFMNANCLARQSDGKILLGGNFAAYNGIESLRMARVNGDGSLDQTFSSELPVDSWVYDITLQSDGRILIVGDFETYGGVGRNNITRLHSDGTLDPSFNPGSGADLAVGNILVQPDGRLLIAGGFTSYNGTPRNYVARLFNDIGTEVQNGPEQEFDFLVQPNPTNGSFMIQLPEGWHDGSVEITDLAGRTLFQKGLSDVPSTPLDLDEPPGVYLLNVYSTSGKVTHKLVKN